jgi:hypothetical protein
MQQVIIEQSSTDFDYRMDAEEESETNLVQNQEINHFECFNRYKKAVLVDESNNTYHSYSMGSSNSISSIMSTTTNTNLNLNATPFQPSLPVNSFISQHLKKHAQPNGTYSYRSANGDGSNSYLFNDTKIPNLKAEFQRKFSDLNFPIGVRACKLRNWLIVCESGANAIKVFERTSGELLHTIKDQQGKFTLCRPSAILLNYENNSEIYVKDDKEILVFDMEKNFELVRKFGNKILNRPYGLAYDAKGNLVLIDAGFKSPIIYTFDKISGKVLNSKPFEPCIETCSNPNTLHQLFNDYKNVLSKSLAPFRQSKCRFIYSNQNSLFVSDLGRSIVYKTNLNGEIQFAFGHYGRMRGQFNEPSGIHVETDGSAILVGDSKNDRLQVFLLIFYLKKVPTDLVPLN